MSKYGVHYKNNEILVGNHFVAHGTNFMEISGKYYYALPVYDTREEAEKELQKYNSCKIEKCDKDE